MVMTIFAFVCVPCGEVRGGGPRPTARVGCHLTVQYRTLQVVDLDTYNLSLERKIRYLNQVRLDGPLSRGSCSLLDSLCTDFMHSKDTTGVEVCTPPRETTTESGCGVPKLCGLMLNL